ncbi:MAG: HNH endonuclease [Chitinispirillaceae bacterium]|nr:HNH endonuclease [Chitinispirillaceae bacterium]
MNTDSIDLNQKTDGSSEGISSAHVKVHPCNMETLFNLEDLPCPYCGKKIIQKIRFEGMVQQFKDWEIDFSSGILPASEYSAGLIKTLTPFQEDFHPIEAAVFKRLTDANRKNPEKTLQELMTEMRPESLKYLHKTELAVLDSIEDLGRYLPKRTDRRLYRIVSEGRSIITNNNPGRPFRRKTFLREINTLPINTEDIAVLVAINKALKLPTSSDNPNAFIVKYSQYKKNINSEIVKSSDIASRFILPSSPTVDHVHPRALGGADIDTNKAVTCFHCNNGKTDIPFPVWLADNPQALVNTQKYADRIIKEVNEGTVHGATYLEELDKTLVELSNGAIRLDLSQLKARG